MPLGEHFPEELLRQQLVPGRVLHLHCQFANKEKFVVLTCVNPDPLVLVINSRVHPFVANRPDLNRCQVVIDQASHEFLSHDSIIACHEVERMGLRDIHDQVNADPSRIKSMVSDQVQDGIVSAVKHAPTITGRDQDRVLAAMDKPDMI